MRKKGKEKKGFLTERNELLLAEALKKPVKPAAPNKEGRNLGRTGIWLKETPMQKRLRWER